MTDKMGNLNIKDFKVSLLALEGNDAVNPPPHSWRSKSLTMVGYQNLTNVEDLYKNIIENNIDGDLVETGVWWIKE
tara:strand:+ start:65 stop:292 length:228 start_codon:yes stop_codon:yes gene_type:complete